VRILVIASEPPGAASGIAQSTERLVQGLRGHGHQVDTLSSADAPYFRSGEVRLSALGGRLVRLAPSIASRYDLINVHGPVPTISDVSLALLAAIRRNGRPRIVYTHHWTLEFDKGLLAGLDGAYMTAHQRLTRLADHIVVESQAYGDLFDRKEYPPVSVVGCGVDAERFRADDLRGYDGADPLRVLFVGQLRPYKGPTIAIDAIANQPGLTLTIVGRGSLEESLRRRISDRGATNVRMAGYLSDDELVDAYRDHDVCVLPSTNRLEAFGLVLLEGMAAGCVPVASDLPGVRDVTRPTGLLFTPGDAHDLRWALNALAARPDVVRRLQGKAIEEAARQSWDAASDAYHELAEQLVRS
jgi:glycosyltransferase involved in cell wall biosynthesis